MKLAIKKSLRYCALVFFLTVLLGCSDNIKFINVESLSSPDNVLLQSIQFNTNQACDAYVEYWATSDTVRYYSRLSNGESDHNLSLINLVPEQEYNFLIYARSGNKKVQSSQGHFVTGKLPKEIPSFKLYEKELIFPGYILIKTFHKSGSLIILNSHGQVVWYHTYNKPVVRPFNKTDKGSIISLVDSSYIQEIDLFGNLITEINTRDFGIQKLHHELIKTKDERFIGLTYEYKYLDLSKHGGLKNDTVRADGMVVFDAEGKKYFRWSVFDVLDPVSDENISKKKKDFGHANSIAIDKDGNYLISFRDFDQIWKIDSSSGEIIWRLGLEGDFTITKEEMPLRQHAVHRDIYSNLLMFDNGSHDRGFSRVLSLKYKPDVDSWEKQLDIRLNEELTTFRMGSAYWIDRENILVCSPKKLLNLAIFNTKGIIVWRLFSTMDSYRAIYLPPDFLENKAWF